MQAPLDARTHTSAEVAKGAGGDVEADADGSEDGAGSDEYE